jgi:hypothetical protein
MTVYVDDANIKWGRGVWCHMMADTLEELNTFAAELGLHHAWLQYKPSGVHYDVTKSVKAKALALGAVELKRREDPEAWRAVVRVARSQYDH